MGQSCNPNSFRFQVVFAFRGVFHDPLRELRLNALNLLLSDQEPFATGPISMVWELAVGGNSEGYVSKSCLLASPACKRGE